MGRKAYDTDMTAPRSDAEDVWHDSDLTLLLAQAHRQVHTRLNHILSTENLPVEQWRILEALAQGDGLTMGVLAERVSMNISALSKTVDRMVSRALVHRRQDPEDHRRVHVLITDFGQDMLARRAPEVEGYRDEIVRRLGSDQAAELSRMLRALAGSENRA